jgi:hypothetical protein
MAVPSVNIVVEQGTDYEEVFTITNPDGTPLDLSGHNGVAKIRKFPESTSFVGFGVSFVPNAGQVVVSLANTVTANLKSGRYYYDVVITSTSTNKKTKVVDGMVLVNATESI